MSTPLAIPQEVLKQHLVVLGKTGAGKSSALRHIVEHLLDKGKRVCIVDPKGDWWGLKSSADGKGPGYSLVGFGNFKDNSAMDVPIDQYCGKAVAQFISSGNRPAIIGFRGWMTSHMVQFWIDFAAGIFNQNAGELYLVGDEFHNFAPKGKIMDPQAGKCLHWSNRLLSEGRGLGIVCLLASQRPQKVHNDTLTSCETLVAMRVVHASDRQAVADWIDGCGDPAEGKSVLGTLAGLARGEGVVWSPECGFGPKRVKFPMFTTFDSFAPPQLQKKVATTGWAAVDLEKLKGEMARVYEDVKANDPKELRAQVACLKIELNKERERISQTITAPPSFIPMLDTEDRRTLKQVAELFEASKETMAAMNSAIQHAEGLLEIIIQRDNKRVAEPSAVLKITGRDQHERPVAASVKIQDAGNGKLGKCERAILTALAQNVGNGTKRQVSLVSGYSIKSSSFHNALSALRSLHYISGFDVISITQEGYAALGPYDNLPTGKEAVRYWIGELGKCEGAILKTLLEADGHRGHRLPKEMVASMSGYSITSSSFHNALSNLRTRELIEGSQEIKLLIP